MALEVTMDAGIFMGYVMGVSDAMDKDTEYLLASPGKMTVGQVCSIVGKYLDNHPEEWHLSGAEIVRKALRDAFLKNKKD
jgi:hypothetical protein